VIEHTIDPNDFLKRSHTVLNEKTLSQMGINGIQGKMLVLASRLDVRGCFPQIPTVMDIDFEHFIDLRRIKRQT